MTFNQTKWRYYHRVMEVLFSILGVLLLAKGLIGGDDSNIASGLACIGISKGSQALAILHGGQR